MRRCPFQLTAHLLPQRGSERNGWCTASSLFLETRPFLLRRINAPFNTFPGAGLDSCLTFLIFSHLLISHINYLPTHTAAGQRGTERTWSWVPLSFSGRQRHGHGSAGRIGQVPATHSRHLGASRSLSWATLLRCGQWG